ncbi:MAG: F0F1 ATP synthase subunit delta [Deltaproteobacteria bacterium]|nr:MAG: F0F1 ATP synthase subunit delta [Deltaproteobacteria bacterium]
MKNIVVARRYAKALMLIADSDNKADEYSAELGAVAGIFESEKELSTILSNPLYGRSKRRELLLSIIESLSVSETIKSYLLLLFDKRRIGLISEINDNYQKLVDDVKNIARAVITSAAPLSEDTIKKLKSALSRKTGKQVEVELKNDPGIIGGIITVIGDLVYDGSIKTQLDNMKESFKRGEVS